MDNEVEAQKFKDILSIILESKKKCKILVNNVGVCGEGIPGMIHFHTQPLWNIYKVLNVNVNTLSIVTQHMIKVWERDALATKGTLGCIITFSTLAALSPQQVLPLFCASKRYGYELNKSLANENPRVDFVIINQKFTSRPKTFIKESFDKITQSSGNLRIF